MGKGVHINDAAMPWNKRSAFLPWTSFMSITTLAIDEGGATSFGAGESVGSPATAGAAVLDEIGATSTDVFGISIAAAGDLVSTFWPFPTDLDTSDPQLEYRVHFVHEATDADEPVWKVHHLDVAKQEAFAEPVANATEVVTFTAHTCSTTADTLEVTAWEAASTNPGSSDVAQIIAVEADNLGSASADEILFVGLEIRYKADMLDDQGPAD